MNDYAKTAFCFQRRAASYLALQRTHYRGQFGARLARKYRNAGSRQRIIRLWDEIHAGTMFRKYYEEVSCEYAAMKPFFPDKATSTLDIGAGMAGIDVLIHRDYGSTTHLLDKNGTSRLFYGFKAQGAFYNSFELATDFLALNGVPREKIHTWDAGGVLPPKKPTFDIILSLLSWGFHYPVETYLDFVRGTLAPHGVLILDVRKNTDGAEKIQEAFQKIDVVESASKYVRLACSEPIQQH